MCNCLRLSGSAYAVNFEQVSPRNPFLNHLWLLFHEDSLFPMDIRSSLWPPRFGEALQAHYRAAIDNVPQRRLPTAVCTIYERASAARNFGVLGGHIQIRRNRSRQVL
jgi:hypothetical protein